MREEAEKRRIAKEKKKKKRTLEYIQQLWDKMLAEDATLLEDTERSKVMGSKYKEVPLEEDIDCWPSKKAKGKQLARYHKDIRIKMESANLCERYMHVRQDCLVYNFR